MTGFAAIVALFHGLAALMGGLVGSFISRKLNEAWGVPRDHWFPWLVSLGVFCAYAYGSTYLNFPTENWRTADFDRLPALTLSAAVLFGHAVSYFIVKARLNRAEMDREP